MRFLEKLTHKLHKEDPAQLRRELVWLLAHMKRYWGSIALVSVLSLVSTAMSLGTALVTRDLIDSVVGFSREFALRPAILLVFFMLGSLVLQGLSSRAGARIHIRVKNEMQYDAYTRILGAGWEVLEPYRSGDLLNRLTGDVGAVCDGVIYFLPGLITAGGKLAGAFAIMAWHNPAMALIALVGVPVTLLLSRALMGRLRSHNLEMKELTGEVMSFQEDSFRNLTSIKAFSITDHFSREMERLQSGYADAYLSFNAFQISMSALLSLVSMLTTAVCFGWGVYLLWEGAITYGALTMFLQLAGTLRSGFSSLVSLAQQAISLTTSAGRIMAVEALPGEQTDVPEGLLEEEALSIQLRQVSFEYQNGEPVLEPFDFTANQGDVIALTGPSGEGKTTLLRLLLGLVKPCSGEAELIGASGKRYPIHAGTRKAFAYVPQGNSVFSGTIASNLRLVKPDASQEELFQALETACALDFVQQFPDGLNHHLGTGGRGVSEGQAQRLAIARALLRKAPILLLDEATSGLDAATERQLLKNLKESGLVQTCILVTHRMESAAFCSRGYEIFRGQVVKNPVERETL